MQIGDLDKFKVPLGGQEIELQQVVHAEGAMPMLRIRIREARRFTIFDIDPLTAKHWGDVMTAWATSQEAADAR